MTEPENADDEEIQAEGEYDSDTDDLKTYLKEQSLSFARQLFCFCSVMMFPIFLTLHDSLNVESSMGDEWDKLTPAKRQERTLVSEWDETMVSVIATICSAILLYLLGRKIMVIIANLQQLIVLLYTCGTEVGNLVPYSVSLVYKFVKEFSLVTYIIYMAEITSPTFRAFFLGFYSFQEIGVRKEMKTASEGGTMNLMIRNLAIVNGFAFLLACFVPETPFFIIFKDDQEKSEETLRWLRTDDPNANILEFNQMLATAENIKMSGFGQRIVSRTFILGLIFSCFLILCDFDPCLTMNAYLNDLYLSDDNMNNKDLMIMDDVYNIINAWKGENLRFYAVTSFLVYSFVIPRKIIFLVSYTSSVLVIAFVALKLGSINLLIMVASLCDMTQSLGVSQLVMILPVEIHPAALREVGVAVSIILKRTRKYLDSYFMEQRRLYLRTLGEYNPEGEPMKINRWLSYQSYYGSLFGAVFIILFMPETQNINMYQLDELNFQLNLPFINREDRRADEDLDSEGGGEEIWPS